MWFCEKQDFSHSTKDKRILYLWARGPSNIAANISTLGEWNSEGDIGVEQAIEFECLEEIFNLSYNLLKFYQYAYNKNMSKKINFQDILKEFKRKEI